MVGYGVHHIRNGVLWSRISRSRDVVLQIALKVEYNEGIPAEVYSFEYDKNDSPFFD
jgi:hypothetical protein